VFLGENRLKNKFLNPINPSVIFQPPFQLSEIGQTDDMYAITNNTMPFFFWDKMPDNMFYPHIYIYIYIYIYI
jgi:hypothetical protein